MPKCVQKMIKCPDGKVVRDSAIAIARAMSKKSEGGFPEIEFNQSPNPPVKAMSNKDVLKWVASALVEESNVPSLLRNLKKYRVTGDLLLSICRIKDARAGRLSCYGIPYGLRMPLIYAVRDASSDADLRPREIPSWVGRKTILIDDDEDTEIRDSAVAIAAYYNGGTFTYNFKVQTYFEKTKAVAPVGKTNVSLTDLKRTQVAAWLSENLKNVTKATLDNLSRSLVRKKVDGKKLAQVATKKGRNAWLSSYGVPFNVRKQLVRAVRKGLKKTKDEDKKEQPVLREPSAFMKAFREAKSKDAKTKSEGWPNIIFVYKESAAHGGLEIQRTVIPSKAPIIIESEKNIQAAQAAI